MFEHSTAELTARTRANVVTSQTAGHLCKSKANAYRAALLTKRAFKIISAVPQHGRHRRIWPALWGQHLRGHTI